MDSTKRKVDIIQFSTKTIYTLNIKLSLIYKIVALDSYCSEEAIRFI